MKKKGIVIFLLLAVAAVFLYLECEHRAGTYEADPIGTESRTMDLSGITLPLKHIVLAKGASGTEPFILENQGFVTYAAGRWLCQLSPAASYVPVFETTGHEKALALKMDGAENTFAYLQEQGYQPTYFFSYKEEMYLVSIRAGREYVMPMQSIMDTPELYTVFQRPQSFSQVLSAVREYIARGEPAAEHYGLCF